MNNETGNNINARNNCVLELSGIVKNYKQGKQTLEVLAGIDLAIRPREVTALVGQSGSGIYTAANCRPVGQTDSGAHFHKRTEYRQSFRRLAHAAPARLYRLCLPIP